jgi:nicotinamidase-related amidase
MALEPLGPRTVHLAVDLQRLFLEPSSPWHAPALASVMPRVEALARALPTLFTRFIPAASADKAPGRWRRYYERWPDVTLERLDPAMLDLAAPLAALAGPGRVVDKATYSLFESGPAAAALEALGPDTLVLSGGETDVCVLATCLSAVDRGYRVVLATDAVASLSPTSHAAVLGEVLGRYPEQVETATTAEIVAAAPPGP